MHFLSVLVRRGFAITLCFVRDELDAPETVEIGSGRVSRCRGDGSRRRKRATIYDHIGDNGPLKANTSYTAFLRVYVIMANREVYFSSSFMSPHKTAVPETTGTPTTMIIIISASGAFCLFLIILVIMCAVRIRAKRRTNNNEPDNRDIELSGVCHGTPVEAKGIDSPVYEDVGLPAWAAKWQITWNNLLIEDRVLGGGFSGEVRSGKVKKGGKTTPSAIKIVKGRVSLIDNRDFMDEFRNMTNIGHHPNIVALLGACYHEDVLYIAMEYLPNGDLRSYLRTARAQSESGGGALSSGQLISFALDVAKGMKHLAKSKVIHRDLAATNILLGEGLVAKVSDFGLSREEDVYVETYTLRIPTRWLAIESLTHQIYTTQSDVWSFGILLWEIATFGGTPYASIKGMSLVERLESGYRMEQPSNCDDEIYATMLQCWSEDPKQRPTFASLVTTLGKMAQNDKRQSCIAVDPAYYENFIIRPEFDDN
ncbi:angiopoietin-1 receptor-like [Patiria miniata]|uniref:Protein kinase domain-containing protein n=1 Tax=Patiria miniata TaxID=46514 RepID=A0A913ZXY1_PATMI|nr:angiopoietin-1 receptor-like [Patiria miniata]